MAQDGPRDTQEGSKTAQEASKRIARKARRGKKSTIFRGCLKDLDVCSFSALDGPRRSKRPQDGPKTAQEAQDCPKTALAAPKTAPRQPPRRYKTASAGRGGLVSLPPASRRPSRRNIPSQKTSGEKAAPPASAAPPGHRDRIVRDRGWGSAPRGRRGARLASDRIETGAEPPRTPDVVICPRRGPWTSRQILLRAGSSSYE